MVKVLNRTLIDHALDHLIAVGVTRVIINLFYKGDLIQDHLENRKDIEIIFSPEKQRLETGGGIVNALSLIGDRPFFVINTDSLWLNGPTSALERLALEWNHKNMDGLLLLHSTVNAYGYDGLGDFFVMPDGVVFRRPELSVAPWLFTGIQILRPQIFENAPMGSFSLNIIYDQIISKGTLFGSVHDGEWFHIGTPSALEETEKFLSQRYQERRHR